MVAIGVVEGKGDRMIKKATGCISMRIICKNILNETHLPRLLTLYLLYIKIGKFSYCLGHNS
jgi:hypothetical protein